MQPPPEGLSDPAPYITSLFLLGGHMQDRRIFPKLLGKNFSANHAAAVSSTSAYLCPLFPDCDRLLLVYPANYAPMRDKRSSHHL